MNIFTNNCVTQPSIEEVRCDCKFLQMISICQQPLYSNSIKIIVDENVYNYKYMYASIRFYPIHCIIILQNKCSQSAAFRE